MKRILSLSLLATAGAVVLLSFVHRALAAEAIPNAAIDYRGFADTVERMGPVRESRRLTEAEFRAFATEPGTIILDARSAERFADRHLQGAVNLPFTEFTAEALAQVIPDFDTRILIYCNNNFGGDPIAFYTKVARASLNLSTYAALTNYGYTNIWELGPFVDVDDATLEFAGTAAHRPSTRARAASAPSAAAPVSVRVEVDRPLLPAHHTNTAIVKVALDAIRPRHVARMPVNLALVIDRSGSMSGEKLHQAKQAAHEALSRLAHYDVVALITYDGRATTLVPARPVGNGIRLRAAIDSISAGGSTNLYGGVELGAMELRERLRENFVHRVILLSDGQANVGPKSPAALSALGADLVEEGISVSTVGLGLGFNEDLMTALARRSDGNTYFVEHSVDLPRIFAQELGDVLSVVARELVVEITFPEGVRPVRIVGRDGHLSPDRVVIELNQMEGGAEKYALVEVEVAPEQAGVRRELAHAQVSYQTEANAPRVQRESKVSVSFTRDEAEVRARANQQVQADYALNRTAEVKDAVVLLADAGRMAEAQAELDSFYQAQSEVGSAYGNAMVSAQAEEVRLEAERLRREGMDNAARKSYRADSLQIIRQQKRN